MGSLSGATAGCRAVGVGLALVTLALGAVETVGAKRSPFEIQLSEALIERPGMAIRAARGALEAGDLRTAEQLLATIATRHPVIADHADLLRMRALVESGYTDRAIAMQATWNERDTPLDADFFTLLGRAYAAKGEEIQARAQWVDALEATRDREKLAELQLSIASSDGRSGNGELAANTYLEIWIEYPWTKAAEVAAEALDAIDRPPGNALRGAAEYRKRGDALYQKRHNEEAFAAYNQALAIAAPDSREHRDAQLQRAYTLFRMRRYPEAAAAFGALPQNDEIRIESARAHARSGEVDRAVRELAELGTQEHSPHAARANLLAGLLAEGEGEEKSAQQFFAQVAQAHPGPHTAAALWRLGWMSYRAQQFDVTIDYFDRLVADDATPVSARARYWRARAQEWSGVSGFEAEYDALARQAPLSYYGFRAARRARITEEASRNLIPRGSAAIAERDLARPRILLEAGLVDEALAELNRLFPRARGLADRLVLAQLYAEAGNFNRPQRLMVDAYGALLSSMPAPEDLDVWWHAWPTPFASPFREVANRGIRVEPGLVYAVMREESGYQPEALSVVGARGLLQIMPETGDRLARREALSGFTHDDLFIPQVNIRLGSSYLAQFMEQFDGRTSAAIASYNAGPEAVSRWIEEGPVSDDEWVEAIPYDQTRGYVKRVLRSLHVYRVLY